VLQFAAAAAKSPTNPSHAGPAQGSVTEPILAAVGQPRSGATESGRKALIDPTLVGRIQRDRVQPSNRPAGRACQIAITQSRPR